MGLLDVLNGMQNGPRGGASRSASGGMSPITMALLGLLAYKAVKGFGSSSQTPPTPSTGAGGGLGNILKGGGLGGMLSGGLGDLLKQFQGAGKADVANSWVGTKQNQAIGAQELGSVLTPEQIDFLTARTGLSREELLSGLSQHLPEVVDHLTPAGRLPTQEEIDRIV